MPTKRGNPRGLQLLIDLTLSDGELDDTDSRLVPNVTIPEPSKPTKLRRLTAAECLRADRIAHGEIDPVSESNTRDPSSLSLAGAIHLVRDTSIPVFENQLDNTGRLSQPSEPRPSTPAYDFHANDSEYYDAAFHQGHSDEIPVGRITPNLFFYGRERSQTSPPNRNFSAHEDYSDHDSVFHDEEDSTDVTWSEERHEVTETMASGRPRRACAPRSFVGLIQKPATATRELVNADKSRANLIKCAATAHRELWENRLVRGYSYNCGKMNDGKARNALIQIAQLFGATAKVEKRREPGKKSKKAKKAKTVVLTPSTRLRPPVDFNIQEHAEQIMSRLRTFSDSGNMLKPVHDRVTVPMETRGLEKKHRKKEKGKAKVSIAMQPKQLAESEQEEGRDEGAVEKGHVVIQETLQSDLVEKAIIAHRELWKNRLVDGFSHSCGAINDGNARAALIQIMQSFGAIARLEKRKESGKGKKAKCVVVKCSARLRSPSELDVREKAESIMRRRHISSHYDAHDTTDPLVSTRDGITNGVQHACTTQATDHSNSATKPELCPRESNGRAGTKDSRKAKFQQQMERKLEGTKIGTTNKGFSMLSKMGWTEGGRLGANENGISEPIVAQFRAGRSGLGSKM